MASRTIEDYESLIETELSKELANERKVAFWERQIGVLRGVSGEFAPHMICPTCIYFVNAANYFSKHPLMNSVSYGPSINSE
jgi:hypothetical protein